MQEASRNDSDDGSDDAATTAIDPMLVEADDRVRESTQSQAIRAFNRWLHHSKRVKALTVTLDREQGNMLLLKPALRRARKERLFLENRRQRQLRNYVVVDELYHQVKFGLGAKYEQGVRRKLMHYATRTPCDMFKWERMGVEVCALVEKGGVKDYFAV